MSKKSSKQNQRKWESNEEPERHSPRKKPPPDATPEQRFKHKWLMSHQPFDEAGQKEWRALMKADTCDILRWKATEKGKPGLTLELSQHLYDAWQAEQMRQTHSGAESEWAQAKAAEAQAARETQLDSKREAAQKAADKLAQKGLVALHERVYDTDRFEDTDDLKLSGAEEEKALLKDYGSAAALKKARADAEAAGYQLVSTACYQRLHHLKDQQRKSVADVLRERAGASSGRGKKRKSTASQSETEDEKDEQEEDEEDEEDEEEEQKQRKKTPTKAAKLSRVTPEQQTRIAKENAKALAALAGKRRANPITAAKTFTAILAAAQEEVLNPREQGFAGSALAPPLPNWWAKFENHISWP